MEGKKAKRLCWDDLAEKTYRDENAVGFDCCAAAATES